MIAAIRDRLLARVAGAPAVLVAEDLEALGKGAAPLSESLFVVPYRERAEPNTFAVGAHRQLVTVQVLVGFLLRQHGDARGARRAERFDALKGAIEGALAGWSPTADGFPLELVAGEADAMGGGVSAFVQTWQTQRFLTGGPP
jgi:hypothetical protein